MNKPLSEKMTLNKHIENCNWILNNPNTIYLPWTIKEDIPVIPVIKVLEILEDVKEVLLNSIKEMKEEYLKYNEFVNPIKILERNFGDFNHSPSAVHVGGNKVDALEAPKSPEEQTKPKQDGNSERLTSNHDGSLHMDKTAPSGDNTSLHCVEPDDTSKKVPHSEEGQSGDYAVCAGWEIVKKLRKEIYQEVEELIDYLVPTNWLHPLLENFLKSDTLSNPKLVEELLRNIKKELKQKLKEMQ